MPRYRVEWIDRTQVNAMVDAKDEAEALEKAKRREVVEGSQDTEPGPMDRRTVKVMWRVREAD